MSSTFTNDGIQEPPVATALDAWRSRVEAHPDHPAVAYFDGVLTAREVDDASDALAAALSDRGVGRGDRVGIYLQNVPQYAITLLALWKIGAAALLLNPMYRGRELRAIVDDAQPVGIVCGEHDVAATAETLRGSTRPVHDQHQCASISRPVTTRACSGPRRGRRRRPTIWWNSSDATAAAGLPHPGLDGDDLALLAYTSGTTGPPKGALNSHANVLATALDFGDRAGLVDGDVVFAVAPLFHITGAMLNAAVALVRDCLLVFANRFDAAVSLDAFVEHRVTYTIGSITVFNAISARAGCERRTLRIGEDAVLRRRAHPARHRAERSRPGSAITSTTHTA